MYITQIKKNQVCHISPIWKYYSGQKKNKKRNWEISKNIQRAAILQSRVGRSQNFSIQWNLQRNLKKSRFFDKMLGKSHINARKMKIRNILLILRILRMLVKNK